MAGDARMLVDNNKLTCKDRRDIMFFPKVDRHPFKPNRSFSNPCQPLLSQLKQAKATKTQMPVFRFSTPFTSILNPPQKRPYQGGPFWPFKTRPQKQTSVGTQKLCAQ